MSAAKLGKSIKKWVKEALEASKKKKEEVDDLEGPEAESWWEDLMKKLQEEQKKKPEEIPAIWKLQKDLPDGDNIHWTDMAKDKD